jgi:hypothetical protein
MGFFVLACIFISIAFITSAQKGGEGDRFVEEDECLSCHDPNQSLGLEAWHISYTFSTSYPIIYFNVEVHGDNVPAPSAKYGVALLTSGGENLSEDGWTILTDPDLNAIPKNYIERDYSDQDVLKWRLSNSPGKYTVKVMAFYGSNGAEFYSEMELNVNVPETAPNLAPELSDPKALLMADGKTYDFEITYTDLEGEYPRNITVNISGLGSFEMSPKNPLAVNFTEGVTYYYLTSLSEGRHSYHFSAYDGTSWNSTTNSILLSLEEENELDTNPLIFGIIIGFIVIIAVYVLRRR